MNRGAHVLIVDDEPLSRDVLARMLSARGMEVNSAVDGPECLAMIERRCPDLILLDVSMPDMSGIDVVKWIRQRFGPETLPIILVSALIDSQHVVDGLEAGANDYVPKPVNMPVLLARINANLTLRQRVLRLVEVETNQDKLAALGALCQRLIPQLSEAQQYLNQSTVPAADVQRIILDMQEVLERIQRIAEYRNEPFTDGIAAMVSASLDEILPINEPG